MEVIKDLGMPWVDDLLDGKARLYLGKGTPVAVVVMAHIVMPQNNRIRSFIRRAQILFVPIDHQLLAVGVKRRNEDNDYVVQDRTNARRVAGCQLICKFCRALRTCNLCRVNVAGDNQNGFSFLNQLLSLFGRRCSRIC